MQRDSCFKDNKLILDWEFPTFDMPKEKSMNWKTNLGCAKEAVAQMRHANSNSLDVPHE
jgi:hypothetical protein